MNLLNITTQYSRSPSCGVAVLRRASRKEGRHQRKGPQLHASRGSHCRQRVRLEFVDPQASTVNIAGTFNDWRPGSIWMISMGQGRWVKELMLQPGRYEYCFVVNGEWMPDPQAAEFTPGLRGRRCSVLVVPPSDGNDHSHLLVSYSGQRGAPESYGSTRELERNST